MAEKMKVLSSAGSCSASHFWMSTPKIALFNSLSAKQTYYRHVNKLEGRGVEAYTPSFLILRAESG